MLSDKEIRVPCKRCGKLASANNYVLDPDYKLMVCPQCVKEKKEKERVRTELAKQKEEKGKEKIKDKPAGWDIEDEYLEKLYKKRDEIKVDIKKIDADKVRYTCPKCKYVFVYNKATNFPSLCPYCKTRIFTFKLK
ncbi:MAG: hypothetical protein ABIE94_01230 [archaeon]